MNIYFDMDGTFVDLYGVPNWLSHLQASSAEPYEQARPLCNMSHFARALNNAQRNGHKIGIVSWTAKNGTPQYNEAVKNAKMRWLNKHLPSVRFDEIVITEYGTPKAEAVSRTGVLFDDEERNRKEWNGEAHNVDNLIKRVNGIVRNV